MNNSFQVVCKPCHQNVPCVAFLADCILFLTVGIDKSCLCSLDIAHSSLCKVRRSTLNLPLVQGTGCLICREHHVTSLRMSHSTNAQCRKL